MSAALECSVKEWNPCCLREDWEKCTQKSFASPTLIYFFLAFFFFALTVVIEVRARVFKFCNSGTLLAVKAILLCVQCYLSYLKGNKFQMILRFLSFSFLFPCLSLLGWARGGGEWGWVGWRLPGGRFYSWHIRSKLSVGKTEFNVWQDTAWLDKNSPLVFLVLHRAPKQQEAFKQGSLWELGKRLTGTRCRFQINVCSSVMVLSSLAPCVPVSPLEAPYLSISLPLTACICSSP